MKLISYLLPRFVARRDSQVARGVMGDDYRENEQAKMVMQQHDVWYIRKVAIKKEIRSLKRV